MGKVLIVSVLSLLRASAESNTCGAGFPRIVIGCWQILERHSDEDTAVNTLLQYVDAGFTSFDTADIYGRSESVLGALRARSDAELDIHTKYVTSSSDLHEAQRINRKSRQALGGTPTLVAFHWWDYRDDSYPTAAAHLIKLQTAGSLHHIGACNFDVIHLKRLVDAGVPIVSNQVQYSLLDRRPENGMLAFAKANGIRLATFGTVGGGWLSDRWLGTPAPDQRAASTVSMRMYKAFLNRWSRGNWALFQELLATLRAVADRYGSTVSIANVASAWVLRRLGAEGGWVIIGVRDSRHLDEHQKLLSLTLDREDEAMIERVLSRGAPPQGDIWSHERGLA